MEKVMKSYRATVKNYAKSMKSHEISYGKLENPKGKAEKHENPFRWSSWSVGNGLKVCVACIYVAKGLY